MAAGYSNTPLPKKLGIKEGHKVAVLQAPQVFEKTCVICPITLSSRVN
jgi:hypothetical protein